MDVQHTYMCWCAHGIPAGTDPFMCVFPRHFLLPTADSCTPLEKAQGSRSNSFSSVGPEAQAALSAGVGEWENRRLFPQLKCRSPKPFTVGSSSTEYLGNSDSFVLWPPKASHFNPKMSSAFQVGDPSLCPLKPIPPPHTHTNTSKSVHALGLHRPPDWP